MRDYLYIPLGGNRVSGRRLYFNLMVVFLLSGLWHGAAWTFVIWGALHGLFLIADRVFLLKAVSVWGKVPRMLLTYFVVLIAWVFFRAESLAQAGSYLGRMFAFESRPHLLGTDARFWLVLVLAILFSIAGAFSKMERWVERRLETPYTLSGYTGAGLVSLMLTLICLTELYGSGFNPFIYFRF
jgi:alginate O-acetyltransferase complex protein AlgI